MKTEQEIMQMVSTCNNYYGCGACPYNPEDLSMYIGDKWKGGCPNYDRKLVYAMGKGYGDVSEYKAEIERLKEKCEELRNEKWDAQDDLDCYYDEMPNKIKQAQVDVLNKVKERIKTAIDTYFNSYGGGYYLAEDAIDDIDELIEEVEKWRR